MKYTFTTLTTLLFLSSINAQEQPKVPKFRVQVEAGISSANMIIDPKIYRVDPITGKAIIKVTPAIGGNLKLGKKTNFEFSIHHY